MKALPVLTDPWLVTKPRRVRYPFGEVRVQFLRESAEDWRVIDTPEKVYAWFCSDVANSPHYDPEREQLIACYENTRRRPLGWTFIAHGTLDTLLVQPREVFRSGVLLPASGVILAHNHPSGDPTPSEADIRITRDLIRAGQLLKVEVLDHLIIGRPAPDRPKAWVSLRELGYFYS